MRGRPTLIRLPYLLEIASPSIKHRTWSGKDNKCCGAYSSNYGSYFPSFYLFIIFRTVFSFSSKLNRLGCEVVEVIGRVISHKLGRTSLLLTF